VSHGGRLGHPDWLTLIEFGRVENDQPRDHRHGVERVSQLTHCLAAVKLTVAMAVKARRWVLG